ncbi:MAG: hypothetical protein RBU30_16235 [Polyangia bacterium]|jgi:hypothetical protein|nr:hypothetical protein [Polyangia bacterium]
MSKQTKIIAIVGGVLIVALLAWVGLSGGGFGAAFEAVGCGGGKKDPPKPRMNIEEAELGDCMDKGFACQRDEAGKPKMAADGKTCLKKPEAFCKTLWNNKCKDAGFKKSHPSGCAKFLKAAAKDDDKDED